ncbi:hypothetical protein KGP36_06090 [Patescibacteria group bacterium]|nr:hypothetical protein [Patescibacteria group bacterium]
MEHAINGNGKAGLIADLRAHREDFRVFVENWETAVETRKQLEEEAAKRDKKRRGWIIVICTILGLLVAIAGTLIALATYEKVAVRSDLFSSNPAVYADNATVPNLGNDITRTQ